jgi:Skp family chaperone for outer membrane proteins
MSKDNLNEDLEKFNTLLGYNPAKGNELTERIAPNREEYKKTLNEEDPEEGGEEEPAAEEEGGEENTDFDFGDEGSPEEGGGEDEAATEEGGEEEGGEDEFGTAGEFTAADELEGAEESDEEVEEIDVTAIVKGSDDAKEMAQQAVTVGQQNSSYLQSLTDKLSNLEAQLTKMDTIALKIGKLEQDVKTPEEKLELRSLDSFPFNMKLSDYWEEKASTDKNYRISTGENVEDGEKTEYVINPKDLEADYSEDQIKNSFNPESN